MLATIGYEGVHLSDFVAALRAARVKVVIDIRERAQSRRRGFSKTRLAETLSDAGIDYVHLRTLGDPKEGRDAARAGDFAKFRKIYSAVLRGSEAQAALQTVIEISAKRIACLLCYERSFEECHRKLVADAVRSKTGVVVKHLGVLPFEQAA